jgi:uncharacterized membrane protein (DUF2068 family)
VLSVVGLVATAGLWMRERWGEWLTIIVCVLSILLVVLVFAPNTKLQGFAVFGVVGFVVVMFLAVSLKSR